MNDKLFYGYGYVYEVYKVRSFSKAAENLFISQSSLSSTIKKIEKRIGVEVFDRSTSPIGLTEYGVEYIKAIEKIMDIEAGFQSHVLQLDELVTGQLSIGGSAISLSHTLPPAITAFHAMYPGVALRLIEGGSYQLEKQLSEGILDLVIDNRVFPEDQFTSVPLFQERLMLAVPKDMPVNESLQEYQLTMEDILDKRHTLPSAPEVPLDHFQDETFLFLRSGNDTRRRAELLCNYYNFIPKIALKMDQQVTAFQLSSYGMGLAFISDWVIKHMVNDNKLVFYKLKEEFSVRNVSIYYRSTRYLTRGMQEFIRIAKETDYELN